MTTRHRLRRTLVALVALPLLLAACGGGDGDSREADADTEPAPATTPIAGATDIDLSGVTLKVGDQVNIAKTLLESSGQLDGVPYDIEWTTFAAGPPLLEAINANAIDIGGVGDTPPIFAQSGGTDFRIVAASADADPSKSSSAVLVPSGSDIDDLSDLDGAKVAFTQGSAAHYLLLKALEEGGLAWSDIDPAPLLPADALAAFSGGDVDAWVVWDPFVALAEAQGATAIATGAGLVPGYGFQVARTGALEDEKTSAAIGDYLSRLRAAAEWAIDNQDDWAAKYAEITGLDPEVVEKTLERFQSTYIPIDDEVIANQQAEADTFFGEGLIPNDISVADIFDDRYTEQLEG